jgi:hypothetical protein
MRTIAQVISELPMVESPELPAPEYLGNNSVGIGFAVESMKRHMTDEGWQIFQGLSENGYTLFGHNIGDSITDVRQAVELSNPGVVVLQDKREWDVRNPRDFREREAKFIHTRYLQSRRDIFKLTILKDSHQQPEYHRTSAEEIGCHAWITYYHGALVKRLAPYIRSEHLVRTYHSIDPQIVPPFNHKRSNVSIVSGAVSSVYPLRKRIINELNQYRNLQYIRHPGYHRNGCHTPGYLNYLKKYKVAICTSSIYGYALRKIIESVASGCLVITDLSVDEVMPAFDDVLIRVPSNVSVSELQNLITDGYQQWDAEKQQYYAEQTLKFYDYREVTRRLANDIESLRKSYGNSNHG